MKKRRNDHERKQLFVRVFAILLVVLMIGGTIVSAIVGALGEEMPAPARDSYRMEMEYLENEQALHITQRLVYHNHTGVSLDHLLFTCAGNMFRRETALCYESEVLETVFPDGFAPAGIEFIQVLVNSEPASWGMIGTNELTMRIDVDLPADGTAEFTFEYWLLLGQNRAFLGARGSEVRLSGFAIVPGVYLPEEDTFITSEPLQHTRWLFTDAADYEITLITPKSYTVLPSGDISVLKEENGHTAYMIRAEAVRDPAILLTKGSKPVTSTAKCGVRVDVLMKNGAKDVLKTTDALLGLYEEWFDAFPYTHLTIVSTAYPVSVLTFPGMIWIPDGTAANTLTLAEALAAQYFGIAAYAEPVADAWMGDTICSYVSLLAVNTLSGEDAFLKALNDRVLDSLNITVPGGLNITTDAKLFTQNEYDLVVRGRGTAVLHETRLAMGTDGFLAGLKRFYEMRTEKEVLGEYDLVAAFDAATGGSWEAFLTEWLFNIGDYLEQDIEWYE